MCKRLYKGGFCNEPCVYNEAGGCEIFEKLFSKDSISDRNENNDREEKKMIKVNQEQIRMMKHAIGFNASKVKRGKYVAYRNYYDCEDNADWNELVEHGFAKKRVDPFCSSCVIYALTKEGKDFLSEMIGVKIIDEQ